MSFTIHFQTCDDTTVGIAHGTRIATRSNVRPLNFELATIAMIKPRALSNITETTVKISVLLTALHQSGSDKTNLELSNPTKPWGPSSSLYFRNELTRT